MSSTTTTASANTRQRRAPGSGSGASRNSGSSSHSARAKYRTSDEQAQFHSSSVYDARVVSAALLPTSILSDELYAASARGEGEQSREQPQQHQVSHPLPRRPSTAVDSLVFGDDVRARTVADGTASRLSVRARPTHLRFESLHAELAELDADSNAAAGSVAAAALHTPWTGAERSGEAYGEGQVACASHANGEEEESAAVQSLAVEPNRLALQSEIDRLQAMIASATPIPPHVYAVAAAAVAAAHAIDTDESILPPAMADTRPMLPPPSPLLLPSAVAASAAPMVAPSSPAALTALPSSPGAVHSSHRDSPPATRQMYACRARDRVAQREASWRQYLANNAHLCALLMMQSTLDALETGRDSRALHAAFRLPGVRTLLTRSCRLSVATLDFLVHSRLFRVVPFSGALLRLLSEPQLRATWESLSWPDASALSWTRGPLRPLFKLMRRVPLAGRLVPELGADEPANDTLQLTSTASEGSEGRQLDSAPTVNQVAASTSSSHRMPSLDGMLMGRLLDRLESQAALITLLQQDRASLQQRMAQLDAEIASERERLQLAAAARNRRHSMSESDGDGEQVTRSRRNRHSQLRMSQTIECIDIPSTSASSSSSLHSAPLADAGVPTPSPFLQGASDARLAELTAEVVSLSALASAQESSLAAREAAMAALSDEIEMLTERIYQLEQQIVQKEGSKEGHASTP